MNMGKYAQIHLKTQGWNLLKHFFDQCPATSSKRPQSGDRRNGVEKGGCRGSEQQQIWVEVVEKGNIGLEGEG